MKKKLKNHKVLLGSWITIPSNILVEVMANAGFDWLAIDLEHSSITFNQAEDLIRIIQSTGTTPLIRIPSIKKDYIKKSMDIGAEGLIIPDVRNVNDLKKVYQHSHYPSKGIRGVGLTRANRFGENFDAYYKWQNSNIILIPQIENINAINNLDEIFNSKMLDAYFVGPFDLSASMNIPGQFDNKKFKMALTKIKNKANQYNLPHGIHVINPDTKDIKEKIKEKYTFIACSLDTVILQKKYKEFTSLKK